LADGLTDEATVVCPLHDRIYSFRTGEGIGNDCHIVVYPVHVSPAGMIMLAPSPAMAVASSN
jgi:nitrite reductase/ring-hydroxylating ferredoxin subunit